MNSPIVDLPPEPCTSGRPASAPCPRHISIVFLNSDCLRGPRAPRTFDCFSIFCWSVTFAGTHTQRPRPPSRPRPRGICFNPGNRAARSRKSLCPLPRHGGAVAFPAFGPRVHGVFRERPGDQPRGDRAKAYEKIREGEETVPSETLTRSRHNGSIGCPGADKGMSSSTARTLAWTMIETTSALLPGNSHGRGTSAIAQ